MKPRDEISFVGSWIIGVKQRCIDETRRTSSAEHNIEHGRHLVSPTRPRWRQNGEKERRKKWFNKPKWSASCLPRSAATTRSFCISDLLPTRTTWALSQLYVFICVTLDDSIKMIRVGPFQTRSSQTEWSISLSDWSQDIFWSRSLVETSLPSSKPSSFPHKREIWCG